MCFGDRAAELVFRGIEIGLEIGPVLGYLVLRFLQLFLLVFQLRLQLFVALVRHRRAVLGSRRRVGVFFRGRLRGGLLRRDHVIKLCVDAVELALQLVDRGVGGGLLRRQMPHRDLLPVTVAKRQSRHDQ